MEKEKLEKVMKEKRYNQTTLSEAIGISRTSFINKLNNSDGYTLGEVKSIKEVLQLTDKQVINIFFN